MPLDVAALPTGDDPDARGNQSMFTMYTTSWCGFCARLRRGLQHEGITYDEVDIEDVEGAVDIVMSANGGDRTVPTLVFEDGTSMTNPSIAQVMEKLAA